MTVALSTFYADFNYGATLQATSLRLVLEGMGHEAGFIRRSPPMRKQIFRPWTNPRSAVRNLTILPNLRSMRRRAQETQRFLDTHQRILDAPSGAFPKADAYVAGSDQIWNVEQSVDSRFFLLPADPNASRLVSYAASFGTERLPDGRADAVREALSRFHRISVREASAATIVEQLLGHRPPVVCDPVFLQSADDWRSLSAPYPRRPDRYILVYGIRKDAELERCVASVKAATGLPVLQLLPGFNVWAVHAADIRRHDASPQEFPDLIDHADAVCTNSFHCMAFSLLFGRPFFATHSTLGRSTRLTNLLETFGETARMSPADGGFSAEDVRLLLETRTGEWQSLRDRLAARGMEFLREALS